MFSQLSAFNAHPTLKFQANKAMTKVCCHDYVVALAELPGNLYYIAPASIHIMVTVIILFVFSIRLIVNAA